MSTLVNPGNGRTFETGNLFAQLPQNPSTTASMKHAMKQHVFRSNLKIVNCYCVCSNFPPAADGSGPWVGN